MPIREEGVVVNASYSCTKRSKTREKNVGKKRYGNELMHHYTLNVDETLCWWKSK